MYPSSVSRSETRITTKRADLTKSFAARMLDVHTDGWPSMFAARGLLLSTTTRSESYGSAQGRQIDVHDPG